MARNMYTIHSVTHERIFESSATQQLKHTHYCTLFTFLSADSMPCRRWSGRVTARTSVGFSCWSPQDIYSAMHTPWLPLYGRLSCLSKTSSSLRPSPAVSRPEDGTVWCGRHFKQKANCTGLWYSVLSDFAYYEMLADGLVVFIGFSID